MKRQSLIFKAPLAVEIQEEDCPNPQSGEVLVKTLVSAISAGTEVLAYTGQIPSWFSLDETLPALKGTFSFPFKYGYACVGEVIAVGEGVEKTWLGRKVFAFNPHESAFVASLDSLIPLPEGLNEEDLLFLPNMETAVNVVQDGRPILGEQVVVFGLGIVGLLTTALLTRFPLNHIVALDRYPLRRKAGMELGITAVFDPLSEEVLRGLRSILESLGYHQGADLVFEVSGAPGALNQAIEITGYTGRIVVGSWYGRKPVALDLGGRFHRSRIQIIASQVSTIAPELSGRWTKARRLQMAVEALKWLRPSFWITHRFSFERAAEAYRLLNEYPEEALQVILTYS
ncbi:zinc-binding dehydrogenase [uncultured Thermanaerothrix sp.]|uniref:zinc-binding dehydrogenase n=1 Tax=uncultured Thermanaerothrix sp. TaxID=1195149 RepID=UPI002622674E|nr:zinc-binding dehydrogenase [uncultured Thermanaerothrix sp.]